MSDSRASEAGVSDPIERVIAYFSLLDMHDGACSPLQVGMSADGEHP